MIYHAIEDYGVLLKRLTADKIELVRQWRNSDEVRQFMEYREEITPEMQESWFARINNEHNYYFILVCQGKEIGVMNLKDIDYQHKEAEKGSLIWEQSMRGKGLGYRANLLLMDFAFEALGLERLIIHILQDNSASIRLNKQLGFELSPDQEHLDNQKYSLTREDYYNRRTDIISKIKAYDNTIQ